MGRSYKRGLLPYCRLQYEYCSRNHFVVTMVTRHYFRTYFFKLVFWLVQMSVTYNTTGPYNN